MARIDQAFTIWRGDKQGIGALGKFDNGFDGFAAATTDDHGHILGVADFLGQFTNGDIVDHGRDIGEGVQIEAATQAFHRAAQNVHRNG